jgi:glucose/arabinose dehydrogenase
VAAAALGHAAPAGAVRPAPHASGIPEPANLAFDARGRLWVASGGHTPAASNGVWLVRRARARPVHAVRGLFSALGLTWHRGRLYVAHIVPSGGGGYAGRVTAFAGFDGRSFARSRVVLDGLPVGRHRLGSLVAGSNGRLYLGIGSRHDAQGSPERLSATVVSFRPGGRGLRVEATGLRNPYGLAFLPGTSRLLISEHGRDDLGLRRPPEELNLVDVRRRAPDFGFPACFGQGGPACRGTRRALVRLPAHAAPGAVAVRAESAGRATAFVPQFGSSFDAHPTGGNVVAVSLTRRAGGWHARARRFAGRLGRQNPLGAAIGPDGDLYVSLWSRARVVRFDLAPPVRARPPAAPVLLASRLLRWVAELLLPARGPARGPR